MSERKKALISPFVNKFSLASRKVSRQIVFIARRPESARRDAVRAWDSSQRLGGHGCR